MIFSIIYDARGGTGREGQEWIYEVLDWNEETGNMTHNFHEKSLKSK